jgi:hypothetical protein
MLKITVIYYFCKYTFIVNRLSIDLLYDPYKEGFDEATDNILKDF